MLLFVRYVSDKYAGKPDALVDVPEGGGLADKNEWATLQEKMVETMIKLEKAFKPYIAKLK